MNCRIPKGGFFAALEPDPSLRANVRFRLGEAGARVADVGLGPLVLAVWTEFAGQGLWEGSEGAVAYDLDLSNQRELQRAVGSSGEEGLDPGELLWRLYRSQGEKFVGQLRGPFGFSLWDAEAGRLLVATDAFGIRPVVHATLGDGLVAASRIRHALLHPGVSRGIDPEAVYHYLFFSAIPSPASIYKSIRKLEPGTLLRHRNGDTSLESYYDLRYRPDAEAGEAHWRRAIPREVRGAVERVAPLSNPETTGCFLSGGTDSSSVAGFYTELAGRPAKTFSIGFDEPGYNELDFAHMAVRRFGTEQHESFVTPGDVLSLVETLPNVYDEPFGNSSVIPTFYCARMAREAGVQTLLAGDGGDEIFGGNERYVKDLVFQRYGELPSALRGGVLEPLLRALPPLGSVRKAQRYVRRACIPHPERFFSYNLLAEMAPEQVFRPEFLSRVDTDCFLRIAREYWRRAAPAHVTDRLLYLDMKFTITDNDLRKVTQMTEAAGVRVRYPLLDRDLVDFTCTIPPDLKVKPGRNRYIFKQAMQGFLPDEILRKKKHGFGLPIAPWFREHPGLASLLRESLFDSDPRITEWVRPEFLSAAKRRLEAETGSYYGSNLWIFLVLELWVRSRES